MLRLFISSVLFLMVTACQPPHEPEKPKGVLRIATAPTDMPIFVNGQPKGNSPSGEGQYFSISLEEGEHKIEILKSIDEEKEQYAEKTLFLAKDTVPIVTLEAKERLTPFGLKEQVRRADEAAEQTRLAEIEQKKAAAIAAEEKRLLDIKRVEDEKRAIAKRQEDARFQKEMQLKNKPFTDLLNKAQIFAKPNIYYYKADGCLITVEHYEGLGTDHTTKSVDVRNLDLAQSTKSFVTDVQRSALYGKNNTEDGLKYDFFCKKGNKCITYRDKNFAAEMASSTYVSFSNRSSKLAKPVINAVESIIRNCQN